MMTTQQTVEVVNCKGSDFEIGLQLARAYLKTPRGRAMKYSETQLPVGFSFKNTQSALQDYAPNIWGELHGIAEGLNISLERAAAEFSNGRLLFPARGCSALMSDGLYGRNYDFAPDRYDGLLAAIQPDNVYASIGFTDRITGRDDGMNEHGLCVGLHHVNEMNWQPGLVCILIVRIVLDQCATTREAVDLLKRLPHGLGFNYSLLDANHNSAVVEASPTGVAVRLGSNLFCTNHFQSNELKSENRRNPSSIHRLAALEAWRPPTVGKKALFDFFNGSNSPVFECNYSKGSGTLHTLVCRPFSRQMIVGVGADAVPISFDLRAWATGAELPVSQIHGLLGETRTAPESQKSSGEGVQGSTAVSGKSFDDRNLAEASFRNVLMKNATFQDVNLAGANFDDINFSGASISRNCNFDKMTIADVSVKELFEAYRNQQSGQKE